MKSLKARVIETFEEYGDWWPLERMADWLNAKPERVRAVYDELEKEGLMDRKVNSK